MNLKMQLSFWKKSVLRKFLVSWKLNETKLSNNEVLVNDIELWNAELTENPTDLIKLEETKNTFVLSKFFVKLNWPVWRKSSEWENCFFGGMKMIITSVSVSASRNATPITLDSF